MEKLGWAIGDVAAPGGSITNYVYKTTDGGTTWIKNSLTSYVGFLANTMQFIDENTGWIVGTTGTKYENHAGIIKKTTDGGLTWPYEFGAEVPLNCIYFIDQNYGWTVGKKGKILSTSNGGNTWINQTSGDAIDLSSVFFIDRSNGWITGSSGTILYTSDGGSNWIKSNSGTAALLNSVSFINTSEGWTVGGTEYPNPSEGIILSTKDGGRNWTKQISNTKSVLKSVYFIDKDHGWAVGNKCVILNTTSGGITAIEKNITGSIPANHFLSQNYPNPFNPTTTIKYSIPVKTGQLVPLLWDASSLQHVTLKVYDLLGREVATLVDEEKEPGTYEVKFDASHVERSRDMASGIYFYRMQVGAFSDTKKFVLAK